MKPKVYFDNVSKKYKLYDKNTDKLLDLFSINKKGKEFYALQNLSFEVNEGETIGVIGINGAGKSTLSNLLAQVIPPTTGTIKINGAVSLIAISAGLNNNLTGIENIRIKCLMLGLTNKQINEVIPDVIDFADIGAFINQPVKNYSSGMRSRLGFAISAHINPDILVIDEALSVGDSTFYNKCLKKINEFKSTGKTIFFISHSISQVSKMADKVMWLNNGKLQEFGPSDVVIKKYKSFIEKFNKMPEDEKKVLKEKEFQERLSGRINDQVFSMSERTSKNSRKNESKKIKKKKRRTAYQVLFFFICFLLSGAAMLIDMPSYSSGELIEKKLEQSPEKNQKEDLQEISINKNAVITAKETTLYNDLKLKDRNLNIEFSSPVFVEKQIGDNIYLIRYTNKSGYINKKDVKLNEVNSAETHQFNEMTFLFPEEFLQSIEFYLAFVSGTEKEIKDSLNGLTSEYMNEDGKKVLNFDYDKIAYYINKEGIAQEIIVKDIASGAETMDAVSDLAALKSSDESLYLIKTSKYNLIYNKSERQISIQRISI